MTTDQGVNTLGGTEVRRFVVLVLIFARCARNDVLQHVVFNYTFDM